MEESIHSKSPKLNCILWDYPASYHNRASTLAFADGRTEARRWMVSATMRPIRKGQWGTTSMREPQPPVDEVARPAVEQESKERSKKSEVRGRR